MPLVNLTPHDILNRDCASEIVQSIDPPVLDNHIKFCMRLCLHEALYNALLHGNLNLHNIHHERIRECAEERLADPVLAARPVFVIYHLYQDLVEMIVKDFGDTVDISLENYIPDDFHGLSLIKQLANYAHFDGKTKEMIMHFHLKEVA